MYILVRANKKLNTDTIKVYNGVSNCPLIYNIPIIAIK